MNHVEQAVAALDEAIATGALEVTIKSGDLEKRVKFQSMADLMNAKRMFERQLNPSRPRASLAVFTRGN